MSRQVGERVVLPAHAPLPLPDDVDLRQACMLALNPVTAWGLLSGMREGQWLVHNAASSSLGRLITRLAAARGVRSVAYGLLGADDIVLPAAKTIFRDVTVRGYSRLRALRAMPEAERAHMMDQLVALFREGALEVPVRATYPLEGFAEAVVRAEELGSAGKVLLVSG